MVLVDEYEKKETELAILEKEFPEKLKKSILQYAVQGKLTKQIETDEPTNILLKKIKAEKQELIKQGKLKEEKPLLSITEEEIPFEISTNWTWVRLENLSINIHYGYTASAQSDGNSRLLRITDIQDNNVQWDNVPFCVTTEKEFETYGLKNRDIMIARTGGTIGKSFIVRKLTEKAVFASYLIRVIPLENINEEYLKIFLETPLYWEQLKDYSMGTGQPNVNGQSLKSLILPLPPLAEQQRIVARIEELFALVEMLSNAKKVKIAEVKAIPIYNNENDTLNIPQKIPFDIASLQLVARQEDDVDEETIADVKKQVQEYYAKKN